MDLSKLINPQLPEEINDNQKADILDKLAKYSSKTKQATMSSADLYNLLAVLEEIEKRKETSGIAKWFPEDGPYSIHKLPKHKAFFDATKDHIENLFLGGNRSGKALPNWEQVITPTGPVRIDSLKEGDAVIGSNGRPTTVVGVFPQIGNKKIYMLTLSDGSEIFASGDHLWQVRNNLKGANSPWKIMSTEQMLGTGKWALPDRPITIFNESSVPIDPYFLGLLLGDGGLSTRGIMFSSIDEELISYVRDAGKLWGLTLKLRDNRCTYTLSGNMRDRNGYGFNPLLTVLRELKVTGLSVEKSLPDSYKYNTFEIRLALLQGLMDTDGFIDKNGKSSFYSSSLQLAQDVTDLARSLGIKATLSDKWVKYNNDYRISYVVYLGATDFPLFRLKRKLSRWNKPVRPRSLVITKIEYVGDDACTCIKVAANDELFLMNNYVPTHNTTAGAFVTAVCATGMYPDWWNGIYFDGPVSCWACGQTGQTTRDTVQEALLGPPGAWGTGMIPADCLGKITARPGVPGAVDTVQVKHVSGRWSTIGFKSYDQKVASFFGTAKHIVWLDEPCDDDVYNECLIRTMTTGGRIIHTITPKKGLTRLLADYLADCDLLAGSEAFEGLSTAKALMDYENRKNADDDE